MDMRTGTQEHYSVTIKLTMNEAHLLTELNTKMVQIFHDALKKKVKGNSRY